MTAQQSLEVVFNKERRRGRNRALEVSLATAGGGALAIWGGGAFEENGENR
jgi:hypothetical protein